MEDDLQRTLGKILATQEYIIKYLETTTKQIEEHIREDKELEKRVDAIETKFSYFTGIAVAAIAVFSLLSDKLLHIIGLK